VADHVPLYAGQIRQGGLFQASFLHPILADEPQPDRVRRPNRLARLGLRHGDYPDGARLPLGLGGGSIDAGPNLLQIGLNLAFRR
jgi:hypothetical protein